MYTPLTCRFNITECPLVKQYLRFEANFLHKEANFPEARVTFDEIPSLSNSPSDYLGNVCVRSDAERGRKEGVKGGLAKQKKRSKAEVERKKVEYSSRQPRYVVRCRLKNAEDERREEGI